VVEKYGVKGVEVLQFILAERAAKGWAPTAMRSLMRKSLKPPLLFKTFSSAWPSKGKIRRLRADSSEAT